jgi:hypothetical protein
MAKGQRKLKATLKEFSKGTLRSSSGAKVKGKKQAVAIALNQARKAGAKVPKAKKK